MNSKLNLHEKTLRFIKRTKKLNKIIAFVTLLIVVMSFAFLNVTAQNKEKVGRKIKLDREEGEVFRGIALGDLMFDRTIKEVGEKKGYIDYIFKNTKEFFRKADYVTANFENPVVTNEKAKKADKMIHLRAEPSSVRALKKLNFTVLNLANNHMLDYGRIGLKNTMDTFNNYQLPYVGIYYKKEVLQQPNPQDIMQQEQELTNLKKLYHIDFNISLNSNSGYLKLIDEKNNAEYYVKNDNFKLIENKFINKDGMYLFIDNLVLENFGDNLIISENGGITSEKGKIGNIVLFDLPRKEKIHQVEINNNKYYVYGEKEEDKLEIKVQKTPSIKSNVLRIGTVGFTDVYVKGFSGNDKRDGVLTLDRHNYSKIISEVRQKSDLLIVHMHYGEEYQAKPNERQEQFSKTVADIGADIIVGHHPHVVQPMEIYKNARGTETVIFYSLGNFVFDQYFSNTNLSALVQFKIYDDKKIKFEIYPVHIMNARPTPITTSSDNKRYNKVKEILSSRGVNLIDNKNVLTFEIQNMLNK